jgi:hypothetical protein
MLGISITETMRLTLLTAMKHYTLSFERLSPDKPWVWVGHQLFDRAFDNCIHFAQLPDATYLWIDECYWFLTDAYDDTTFVKCTHCKCYLVNERMMRAYMRNCADDPSLLQALKPFVAEAFPQLLPKLNIYITFQ